jgi:DNA-binding transcriptional LysR family regulator
MAFDFRALRYFVAVAEELHFTRAAERLYIAQPALSEQIRRLEGELGVQLLRRTTRKVELTAAGEEFLSRARRILAEADEALADASRAARGETGSIRVAVAATAGVEFVPRVLRAFRKARPRVHLDLRQIDCPFRSRPFVVRTNDESTYYVCCGDAHPRLLHRPRGCRTGAHRGRDPVQRSVRPGTREHPG